MYARKQRGFTLERLADVYNRRFGGGLSKGTLSKYENNKQEPMISTVGNLSAILGVSVDYLLNGEESDYIDIYAFDNISPVLTRRFPMLGKIACGEPIYCDEEYETFVEASADINADFCLTARGDSMINARIFDGDIVFIRAQPQVENGEIAAVIVNDEATLKRVYLKSDRIILRPENPLFPVLQYEGAELTFFHMILFNLILRSILLFRLSRFFQDHRINGFLYHFSYMQYV